MSELQRNVFVQVGKPGEQGKEWRDLRIDFNCVRTDNKDPNQGKIQIYNLNPDSRGFIKQEDNHVFLYAGRGDSAPLIFSGKITDTMIVAGSPDIITEIESKDGDDLFRVQKASLTLGGPIKKKDVLDVLAKQLGIVKNIVTGDGLDLDGEYIYGATFFSSGKDALNEVVKAMGGNWSIQNGSMIVTAVGKPTGQIAVVINSTSGMVGSPLATKDGMKCRALLNHSITPRRLLSLQSMNLSGTFIVKKSTFIGSNGYANDFYTDVEAITYK